MTNLNSILSWETPKSHKMLELAEEWDVTARAYERRHPEVPVGPKQTERINIRENSLFNAGGLFPDGVRSAEQIKETYESFWNDINPDSEEIVKVLKIQPVKKSTLSWKIPREDPYINDFEAVIDGHEITELSLNNINTQIMENYSTIGLDPQDFYIAHEVWWSEAEKRAYLYCKNDDDTSRVWISCKFDWGVGDAEGPAIYDFGLHGVGAAIGQKELEQIYVDY